MNVLSLRKKAVPTGHSQLHLKTQRNPKYLEHITVRQLCSLLVSRRQQLDSFVRDRRHFQFVMSVSFPALRTTASSWWTSTRVSSGSVSLVSGLWCYWSTLANTQQAAPSLAGAQELKTAGCSSASSVLSESAAAPWTGTGPPPGHTWNSLVPQL